MSPRAVGFRTLGQTGLSPSEIVLGTEPLGHLFDKVCASMGNGSAVSNSRPPFS